MLGDLQAIFYSFPYVTAYLPLGDKFESDLELIESIDTFVDLSERTFTNGFSHDVAANFFDDSLHTLKCKLN